VAELFFIKHTLQPQRDIAKWYDYGDYMSWVGYGFQLGSDKNDTPWREKRKAVEKAVFWVCIRTWDLPKTTICITSACKVFNY
jgi:hypothetical protein